jgi:hypothetical protein
LAVFRGFIVGGGPETVVAPLNNSSKERQAYSLNKGLDLDGDRRITKEELAMVAFGVGRFSVVPLVAETRPQISEPQQRGISVPTQSRIISKYVVIPSGTKSEPTSSPAASFGSPTVKTKTCLTYVR